METYLSHLHERLKEERVGLRLNQAEAAEKTGVTREHWGRCERGAAVPGGEMLARLATAGADVHYVLTGSREFAVTTPLNPEEQTMLDYFRQAPPAVRRAALGALIGASAPVAQAGNTGVSATVKRSFLGFASARGGDKKGKP